MSLTANDRLFAEFLLDPTVLQIRRDVEAIAASLPLLLDISMQFAVADDLLPSECDQAVLALNALGHPARSLRRILKQSGSLPLGLASHRFELLVSLCFIETASDKISAEIARFRLVCRDPHWQIARQRTAIHRQVKALLQVSDEIPNQIIPLLSATPITTRSVHAS